MTTDTEARALVKRLKTREPYKSALQIACEENISQAGEQTVGEMRVFLGQGDYPTIQHLADAMTRDANQAADTIAALLAENERLQEIERLVLAANTLRQEYHALPNESLRPGSKESRKSRAKRLWLRAFGRAARAALATQESQNAS